MKFGLCVWLLIWPMWGFAAVSNWEPFEMYREKITLPIKINGVPTRVMLDTGANINSVSARFIEALDEPLTASGWRPVQGMYGKEKRRTYNNINLELWGTSFNLDNLVALNLPVGIGMLLGSGFFDQFIVQIDYPQQQLRLLSRDSVEMRKLRNVKTRKISGMLSAKVNLNGQKDVWLQLDTGASQGIITRRLYAEEYGWLESLATVEGVSSGANRTQTMQRFALPYIELGPFTIESVPTAVPEEGKAITYGRAEASGTGSNIRNSRAQGVLGYEVLKHFIVTIDYRKGYVHLQAP